MSELWNEAYEELKLDDATSHLVQQYEAEIAKQIADHAISTVETTRLQQMEVLAQAKAEEVERGTWKIKFASHQFAVRDIVGPAIGIIEWSKEYIGQAVESSGSAPASIAWAGVCLLLPVSTRTFDVGIFSI